MRGGGDIRYRAFISYSHERDGRLAPGLQSVLQVIAKPWYRRQSFSIFRDVTDLSTSPHLWTEIERALGQSEYFILLASPRAAGSKWVHREIGHWLQHKSVDSLILCVTDGTVVWDEAAKDFDWSQTTALPRLLAGKFSGEPLYVDLRAFTAEKDLSLRSEPFVTAARPIAATLHGTTVAALFSEEQRQHRRTIRIRNSAVAALSLLLAIVLVLWFLTVRERNEAIRQRNEAARQRNEARRQLGNALEERGLVAAQRSDVQYAAPLLAAALSIEDTSSRRTRALDALRLVWRYRVFPSAGRSWTTEVAWSPDGTRLATIGDGDSRTFIWSLEGGAPLVLEHDPNATPSSVQWAPDGNRLLTTADFRSDIRIWDAAPGAEPKLAFSIEHPETVDDTTGVWAPDGEPVFTWSSGVWAPDGKRVFTWSSADQTFRISSAADGALISASPLKCGKVGFDPFRARWSADGLRLAAGCDELGVYDAAGGLLEQLDGVESFAWAPSGRRLAVGRADGEIRIRDHDKGRHSSLGGPPQARGDIGVERQDGIVALQWSPAADALASFDDGGMIRLWKVDSGSLLSETRFDRGTSIGWSGIDDPFEQRVTVASHSGRIAVVEARSGTISKVLDAPVSNRMLGGTQGSVAWSRDGEYFAAAGNDGVFIWDASGSKLIATFKVAAEWGIPLAWSPDGRHLASGSSNGQLHIWTMPDALAMPLRAERARGVENLAWSHAGDRVAMIDIGLYGGSEPPRVLVWRKDGRFLWEAPTDATAVGWSRDDRQVLALGKSTLIAYDGETGGEDTTIPVQDCAVDHASLQKQAWIATRDDGTVFAPRSEPRKSVCRAEAASWSNDGARLAVSDGGSIALWDTVAGVKLQTIQTAWNERVSWSPDGSRLLVPSDLGERGTLVAASTGQPIRDLELDGVSSVGWSDDGARVAIGTYDALVICDGVTGEILLRRPLGDAVTEVRWAPHQRFLATINYDFALRLWDGERGAETFELLGPRSPEGSGRPGRSLGWSADGELLAAGVADGTVSLWRMATARASGAAVQKTAEEVTKTIVDDGRALRFDDLASRSAVRLTTADFRGSIKDLETAISLAEPSGDLHAQLAITHALAGDPETAVEELDEARRLDPSNLPYLLWIAALGGSIADQPEGIPPWFAVLLRYHRGEMNPEELEVAVTKDAPDEDRLIGRQLRAGYAVALRADLDGDLATARSLYEKISSMSGKLEHLWAQVRLTQIKSSELRVRRLPAQSR